MGSPGARLSQSNPGIIGISSESSSPIQGTLGELQDFSFSLHEPGRSVFGGLWPSPSEAFIAILHDPTEVVLLDECLSFLQIPCGPPRVIFWSMKQNSMSAMEIA